MTYINDADAVGSIPPPASMKGMLKAGMAAMKGSAPSLFMDKIGERIAFERAGTRLYEALITKYQAVHGMGQEVLPAADQLPPMDDRGVAPGSVAGESPLETLHRIRNEELEHFKMLCAAMEKMGGDPTAQTPCADVTATASMGIVQVLTDPRTTLAQCLNAMLTAELTDNVGWELLVQLAEDAGENELAGRFLGALGQEQEHLAIVKGWLTQLMMQGAGTPAV
jgi:rubrerythrin